MSADVPETAIDAALAADAAWAREAHVITWMAVGREHARAMLNAAAPLIRADERKRLLDAGPRDLIAVGAGPLLDPDCRDGKCGSCVGAPCEHECHKRPEEGHRG